MDKVMSNKERLLKYIDLVLNRPTLIIQEIM